ncbi:MAG: hypothetical protein K8U57_39330 [Planctomycetes bacterium]|nr:hypothetical protein [Planctomycetota bacterium]
MAARKKNQFAPTFEALEAREVASANPVAPPDAPLDQAHIGESHTVVRVANQDAPRALAASAPFAADYPDPLSSSHRSYIGVKDLRKGDILLNTTDALISNAIKKATNSNYNHAAIYVGDGKVVQAVGDGVELRELKGDAQGYFRENDVVRVMVLRNTNLTVEQQEAIANFAVRKVNEKAKYNGLGVIGAFLQTKPLNYTQFERNNYFCSQLVAAAYSAAKAPLDKSLDLTPRNLSEMVNRINLPTNLSPQLTTVGALYDAGFHRSVREGREVINLDLTTREQQLFVDLMTRQINQQGGNSSVRLDRLTLDSSKKLLADFTVTRQGVGDFTVSCRYEGDKLEIKIGSPKSSPDGVLIENRISAGVEGGMLKIRNRLVIAYADSLTPRTVAPQTTSPVGEAQPFANADAEFTAAAGFNEPILVG